MSDHLIHLTSIDDGGAYFDMTCEHESGAWPGTDEDGILLDVEGCWLMSHWENIGCEMFRYVKPGDPHEWPRNPAFPMPVTTHPDDVWAEPTLIFDNQEEHR